MTGYKFKYDNFGFEQLIDNLNAQKKELTRQRDSLFSTIEGIDIAIMEIEKNIVKKEKE